MTAPPVRRRATLLLVAAATAAAATLATRPAAELVATASLSPADHPWAVLDREITAQFGFGNPVVWVIAARQGTVWTPRHLGHVQALTRGVLQIRGVVATDVISLGSPNLRDFEASGTALRPLYLMAVVPETPEQIEALRRRIDGDPNYRGTLVSTDGRAAMVVANFRTDADAAAIGTAARALQAAHRDAETEVHVVGAPLVRTMRAPVDGRAAAGAAVVVLGAGALAWTLGIAGACAVLGAAVLAAIWTAAGVAAAGLGQLPWSLWAILSAMILAGAAAAVPLERLPWRTRLALGAALAGAYAATWPLLGAPADAMAVAGVAGSLLAMLASGLCAPRHAGARAAGATRRRAWAWAAAALVLAGGAAGLPRLRPALGLAGYGQRYLPGAEGDDLRAMARYFSPPTALAIRLRGTPRFVAAPAALRAFEGVTAAARADPAVVNALSIADLLAIVHRAFNPDAPPGAGLPDDEGLMARYLALAYSPGFRRFVDRSLSTAAIWIYLAGDDPADLARVLDQVRSQLAAQPVPGAEADLVGGDGAGVLLMAGVWRSLIVAGAAWLVAATALLAAFCGWRAARAGATAGALAVAVVGGGSGWVGAPLDLVLLPLIFTAAAAAAALGAVRGAAGAPPPRRPWRPGTSPDVR